MQISGTGSASQAQYLQAMREKLFAKLDTNQDGGLDIDELKAGAEAKSAQGGRSGPDPAQLLAKADSDGDGKLTAQELEASRPSFSAGTGQALLQAQEEASTGQNVPTGTDDPAETTDTAEAALAQALSDLVSSLDTDGDGKLSTDELKAGLTQEAKGPPPGPPPGGPPPGEGAGQADASGFLAEADSDGDGVLSLEELQASAPEGADENAAADLLAAADSDGDGTLSLDELNAARPQGPPPPPAETAAAGEDSSSGSTAQSGGSGLVGRLLQAYARSGFESLSQSGLGQSISV